MINARQIRAARALLNWSQTQLSEASGIARSSIKNLENEITAPRTDTGAAIREAFESRGVEFLPGSGVRMREESIIVLEGEDAEEQFMNDIYEAMLQEDDEKEVLIYGLEELDPSKHQEEYALAKAQIDRLARAGIKERILSKQGNTHFIGPWHYYRWLPGDGFASVPLFIYGNKIALSTDKPPYKTIIIDNKLFAESCRYLFNFAWDRAVVPDQGNGDENYA